jgi:hypothetical protein
VRLINQKSLIQIRKEKQLAQMPMSDLYLLVAEMNANLSAFFDHYFSQFPEQE